MSTHPDRLAWVDLMRGTALVGMMAYHAAWDLDAFGFTSVDPGADPGWRLLGHGVATVFLALSGFSLSLAMAVGRSGAAVLGRLIRIAAAAGLVSAASCLVSPDAPIWFGILHCIVITNTIAITLRRLSAVPLLAIAAAAWLAPQVLPKTLGNVWAWIGLSATEPAALDFRPVLPWLAPVLVGLSLGKVWRDQRSGLAAPVWSAKATLPVRWAGRHSLMVYLVHQPIMLGILFAASHGGHWHLQPTRSLRHPGEATAFLRPCRKDCAASGGEDALCRSMCDCVLTRLARSGGTWSARSDRAQAGVAAAVSACRRGDPSPDD